MKLLITFCAIAVYAVEGYVAAKGAELMLYGANEQFSARMLNEVVKSKAGKSVVISAFSVLTPLAQLSLASVGESHDEILKCVGLPSDDVLKAGFPAVNSQIKAIKGVDLKMASRMYVKNTLQINEALAATSKQLFDTDVKKVDFNKNQAAATEINKWVEGQTNNRIKDLVDASSLNGNTKVVLVNALYFKGKWDKQFQVQSTVERPFFVNKGLTKKVPTMFQHNKFLYGESRELNAKLLEMPYEGKEASFLIILPNEIDGLPALEEKLRNPEILKKAVQNMMMNEVDVFLPKFKIETTTDLKEVLAKMGVHKVFDASQAHLDKLVHGESGLYVSEAIQKAFIEVSEEGVEAAAANVVHNLVLPMPVYRAVFNADRPFYYELKANYVKIFRGQHYG